MRAVTLLLSNVVPLFTCRLTKEITCHDANYDFWQHMFNKPSSVAMVFGCWTNLTREEMKETNWSRVGVFKAVPKCSWLNSLLSLSLVELSSLKLALEDGKFKCVKAANFNNEQLLLTNKRFQFKH